MPACVLVLFACRPGANTDTDCAIHGPAVWNIHNISGCMEKTIWGMYELCIYLMIVCIAYYTDSYSRYVSIGESFTDFHRSKLNFESFPTEIHLTMYSCISIYVCVLIGRPAVKVFL